MCIIWTALRVNRIMMVPSTRQSAEARTRNSVLIVHKGCVAWRRKTILGGFSKLCYPQQEWVLAPWYTLSIGLQSAVHSTHQPLLPTRIYSWFAPNQSSGSRVTYFHCRQSRVVGKKRKKRESKQPKPLGKGIQTDFPAPPWVLSLATIWILSPEISNLLNSRWQLVWGRFISTMVVKSHATVSASPFQGYFFFSCSRQLAVFLLLGSCSKYRGMEWLPCYMAAWPCIKAGC